MAATGDDARSDASVDAHGSGPVRRTAVVDRPGGQSEHRPLDPVTEAVAVQEAWEDLVPAGRGTSAELLADVQADLRKLQQMLAEAVAEEGPTSEAPLAATEQPAPAAPQRWGAARGAPIRPSCT
ncbi:hypothetical protein ACGF8B_39315 [Streptomyces sp. NPDC047917]|uniref:hypothetical protein n=1 Tax=Streptomyces sp. NPDC047917 TaxID=3365491 RepID=UPI00371E75BA